MSLRYFLLDKYLEAIQNASVFSMFSTFAIPPLPGQNDDYTDSTSSI